LLIGMLATNGRGQLQKRRKKGLKGAIEAMRKSSAQNGRIVKSVLFTNEGKKNARGGGQGRLARVRRKFTGALGAINKKNYQRGEREKTDGEDHGLRAAIASVRRRGSKRQTKTFWGREKKRLYTTRKGGKSTKQKGGEKRD